MFGDNLKVHFAGADAGIPFIIPRVVAGVHYSLYSCYPFISSRQPGDDMRMTKALYSPVLEQKYCSHVIQDSGLFTMMFGSGRGQVQTMDSLIQWQDKLMQFVRQNGITATCVELDCQKVLGVEQAWTLRRRMRDRLPNRQINVFHLEDGAKGLDRLIEFSDYIAVSVPELRQTGPGYIQRTVRLAEYIKGRKPEIDIHLLGCTDSVLLRRCRFCTSADSTAWTSAGRWGTIYHNHVTQLRPEVRLQYRAQVVRAAPMFGITPTDKTIEYTTNLTLSAVIHKQKYMAWAGDQE